MAGLETYPALLEFRFSFFNYLNYATIGII